MGDNRLLAIVGPTAVGKSAAALRLADMLNGEIVSCDSMQVYRYMDIGTAKATAEEQKLVPHHMLDLAEPDYDFTVAEYQRQAQACIADIQRRGKLPVLTGGSGLYYQAIVDNYDFMPLDGQPAVRRQLEARAEREGLPALFAELQRVDPAYARVISGHDRKRIIRALEVYAISGRAFSQTQRKRDSGYDLRCIGLTMERERLYERIETRVDHMLKRGLQREVEDLLRRGYSLENKALNSLGYRQMVRYLAQPTDYEAMVRDIKMESRRFAKRQYTWFKRDERIHWISISRGDRRDDISQKILALLAREDFIM